MMTATTATDAWISFGYVAAGFVWAMRKGWQWSKPDLMADEPWWVL